MSTVADLNVAIYGSSNQPEDSWAWQQANQLGRLIASTPGHRVIAAGPKGVALSVATGVRKVVGVPEPTEPTRIDVYTDRDEGQSFFNVEGKGDGEYFNNLASLVKIPEIFVFFPGYQGTKLQLYALLHMIQKGLPMDYRRIILMYEHDRSLAVAAQSFWFDVADTKTGGDDVPWQVASDISVVKDAVVELEVAITRFVLESFEDRNDTVLTAHDFKNSFLVPNLINYSTASQVVDRLIESDQIRIPQTI
jgi:hypothetical protein